MAWLFFTVEMNLKKNSLIISFVDVYSVMLDPEGIFLDINYCWKLFFQKYAFDIALRSGDNFSDNLNCACLNDVCEKLNCLWTQHIISNELIEMFLWKLWQFVWHKRKRLKGNEKQWLLKQARWNSFGYHISWHFCRSPV